MDFNVFITSPYLYSGLFFLFLGAAKAEFIVGFLFRKKATDYFSKKITISLILLCVSALCILLLLFVKPQFLLDNNFLLSLLIPASILFIIGFVFTIIPFLIKALFFILICSCLIFLALFYSGFSSLNQKEEVIGTILALDSSAGKNTYSIEIENQNLRSNLLYSDNSNSMQLAYSILTVSPSLKTMGFTDCYYINELTSNKASVVKNQKTVLISNLSILGFTIKSVSFEVILPSALEKIRLKLVNNEVISEKVVR